MGGKLHSQGGEHSNRGAEGKAERFLHRGLVPTHTHQPERLVCSPAGWDGWGLGAEAPALEVRAQGEEWGWLSEHSQKGGNAPQLTRRESGKNSGTAYEARVHCFGVHKERRFRTPPKRAPEMGHKPRLTAWTPETGMKR